MMSKTFNVNILNHQSLTSKGGFGRTGSATAMFGAGIGDFGRSRTTNQLSLSGSPNKLVRTVGAETCEPFSFIPNAKIPDLAESRREESEERRMHLMRQPKHKTQHSFGPSYQAEKLMSAPLTM